MPKEKSAAPLAGSLDVALDDEVWASILAGCSEVTTSEKETMASLKNKARAEFAQLRATLSIIEEHAGSIIDACEGDVPAAVLSV